MIRLTVLGSSSSGNACVLECGNTKLLIDAGFSAKQLRERMARAGISPSELRAILVTHKHSDHVKGLKLFAQQFDIPVYLTYGTYEGMNVEGASIRWNYIEINQTFYIEDVRILAYAIPHDVTEPVGFRIDYAGHIYGHLSDSGHITDLIRRSLVGVNILYLESNYDPELLAMDMKRPSSTKQRILSHHGHLSNQQAADFLAEIQHEHLHHVILAHLSGDCNRPELAYELACRHLTHTLYTLNVVCAHPDELTGPFHLA